MHASIACGQLRTMASPKLTQGRRSEVGACYVVTTVTQLRRPLFRGDAELEIVRRELSSAWFVNSFAWVVMPDHVHWLFQLRDRSLGCIIGSFKARTTFALKKSTGLSGPVWQPGYFDHRIGSHRDLAAQAQYILANPMRSGMHAAEATRRVWCTWKADGRFL